MPDLNDAALIYTVHGNLPLATLAYHHEWTDTSEFLKFREWYTDADGATVKESAHVYVKQPTATQSASGAF